jgi:Mlc titration factor MtfA (ptsG expression regulator)
MGLLLDVIGVTLAFFRHSSSSFASKGLLKKQVAPPWNARLRRLLPERDHQDHRRCPFVAAQLLQQFDAAHARHLQVGDDALVLIARIVASRASAPS